MSSTKADKTAGASVPRLRTPAAAARTAAIMTSISRREGSSPPMPSSRGAPLLEGVSSCVPYVSGIASASAAAPVAPRRAPAAGSPGPAVPGAGASTSA
eukprot:1786266-Heterocapsa_arctica.AAC.1